MNDQLEHPRRRFVDGMGSVWVLRNALLHCDLCHKVILHTNLPKFHGIITRENRVCPVWGCNKCIAPGWKDPAR